MINLFRYFFQVSIAFLKQRVSRVQFIMILAICTGLLSGLLAIILKSIVHFLQEQIHIYAKNNFIYYFFPLVGISLSAFLIYFFFKNKLEKGIAMVLTSIAKKSSIIDSSHLWKHILTSSLTVGMGGSVGLEAPIVATGSATGSNIAGISDLNYQERTLLIACGAASGIAAVFNAPIAGVIFAIEILLTETIISYFIPLILSSAAGALCAKIILKEETIFNIFIKVPFDYRNVPFYVLLGLMSGFVSLYYAKSFKYAEYKISKIGSNRIIHVLIGSSLLAILYFFMPQLFGEGYDHIKLLALDNFNVNSNNLNWYNKENENLILIFLSLLIFLTKPIAAGITIGSGGNGGNFAPSLFTGSFLGFFFAKTVNYTGLYKLPIGNFSLVGMAGVLCGVMYAPLTAIFLIAEITNGYELFIPLMIVSSISFFIVKTYEPFSMEVKKLALEGKIFTHKKEKNILSSIQLDAMLQDHFETIRIDQSFKDLVEIIKKSDKNIYAVIDVDGKFIGIIELNDIKQKLFTPHLYSSISIKSIMKKPRILISIHDEMSQVMENFDLTQSWYLPVIDSNRTFLGFLSKTKLFNKYREILASQIDLYDL